MEVRKIEKEMSNPISRRVLLVGFVVIFPSKMEEIATKKKPKEKKEWEKEKCFQ